MKTLLKSLSMLVLAAVASTSAFAKTAAVGSPAPEFTLTDLSGKSHRLSDFKGKTVVLEWVNPECPFVVKHYDKSGNIPKLQREATADGVVWLAINSGHKGAQGDFEPAQATEWLKKNNAAPTAYMRDSDGTVGKMYGAKTTPHIYVINPEGKLVYNGAIDSIRSTKVEDIAKADNYASAAIQAAKSGGMPAKSTTEPYGCGVKY